MNKTNRTITAATSTQFSAKDLKRLANGNKLTAEEEALSFEALFSAEKKNDRKNLNRHFEKIFAAYRPLAASIAFKFRAAGVDIEDVAEEADLALAKAIFDFRDDKGAKFSTFATMRIKFAILEAFNGKFRLIAAPRNRTKILDKMRKAKEAFKALYNRDPTPSELCAAAQISKSEMKSANEVDYRYTSMNAEIGEGDDACSFGDFIEDKAACQPPNELDGADIMARLRTAMGMLPEREQWVLVHRTLLIAQGLDSAATYEEIGRQLKISKVSARNIEKRALAMLRSTSILRELAHEYGIGA